MIKSISTSNPWLQVQNGSPGSLYINNYNGQQGVGNVRFNTNSQNFEVYDGNTWMSMPSSYTSIELSPEANLAIQWANEQRHQELRLTELMEKYPGLKDAHEKFEIMRILVSEHEKGEQ